MSSSSSPSRSAPDEKGITSLLGRLSLSPAKKGHRSGAKDYNGYNQTAPTLPEKHSSRSPSNAVSHRLRRDDTNVAGPSYETISPQGGSPRQPRLAPDRTTFANEAADQRYSRQPVHRTIEDDALPASAAQSKGAGQSTLAALSHPAPMSTGASTRRDVHRNNSASLLNSGSPPRTRQAIYPALASPPKPTQNGSITRSDVLVASPPRVQTVSSWSGTPEQRSVASRQRTHSPISPPRSPANMHVIASSSAKLGPASPSDRVIHQTPYRYDKEGRPLMSARRSASSSSKTITHHDRGFAAPLPSPPPLPNPSRPRGDTLNEGMTEASAYARAMASNLSRSESGPDLGQKSLPFGNPDSSRTRGERPLPRPPGDAPAPMPRASSDRQVAQALSRTRQPSVERIAASERAKEQQSGAGRRSDVSRELHGQGVGSVDGDILSQSESPIRKPTIAPSHVGTITHTTSPSKQRSATGLSHLPIPTSPKAAVSSTQTPRAVNGTALYRKPGRPSLDFIIGHAAIQSSLLRQLGINAFLSLSGSSEEVRRQFTGESVGRWVLGEWAVEAPEGGGSRWPNLTVWEGFLESLLHDPATYSTYPARWHNLLRHLSLSHTLVVLYLRALPASCFPNHSLLPFEDDGLTSTLPFSASSASLSSLGQPRSRVGSTVGSDAGSVTASKPPRRERVIEIVMPEPLAAQPQSSGSPLAVEHNPVRRRGSISSLASAASFSFGRRRSNSLATDVRSHDRMSGLLSAAEPAASMAPGKAALPPVSYPSAKRYGFRNASDVPVRRRTATDSRPGSVYSFQTGPSLASYAPRMSHTFDSRNHLSTGSTYPLAAPPPIGVRPRSSFGSDSTRRSDVGSPVPGRRVPLVTRRPEPAFDKPMPYIPGRAPVLRVFVPLSEKVRRWPSAEGALAAVEELEKCGALKRMRLGDLVVNTAISSPRTTEHVLLYVPFVKHLLVPLQYSHLPTGHLPSYVDSFALPPSYYFPFLPTPQIIFLNLGPYREQGLRSMRLASDRRDMTVASGARISAKRYLYVAGVEVGPQNKAAPEWHGMVSLEAEGTAEGKAELIRRFGAGPASETPLAAWEIVKEKSMGGTVWLRVARAPSSSSLS